MLETWIGMQTSGIEQTKFLKDNSSPFIQ